MEGYLSIVTKGFATTRLRKVWVVLDRQQLTWYDHLDLTDQLPKKLKGVMFIRDAVLKKVADTNTAHALSIECDAVKTVFYCENATVCSNWYKALTRCITIHNEIAQKDALPKRYTQQLSLPLDEELTKANIAKAYKRLCLKEHPDKGGNPEEFNKIKEAYNYLVTRQTYIDEMDNTVPIQYEATIVKQAGKVGFGMSVNDDRANERLLVGKVQDDIIIVDISEESGGKIKPGDRIIGIDHDDCSHWMMSRLVPRLGLTRIPVGGTTVFTFERRVSPDELDEEDFDDEDYEMTPQPSPMPGTIYQKNSNSPLPRSSGTVTPSNASDTAEDAKSKHTASEPGVRFATAPSVQPAASAASSSTTPMASEQSQAPQPPAAPVPDTQTSSPTSSGDGSPVPQATASADSVLGSPSSMQARAAARERLRLRALEASSAAAEPIIVVPTAHSDSIQPSAQAAPALPPPVVVLTAPVVLEFPRVATASKSLRLQPPSVATSGAVLMAPYSIEAGDSPYSPPPPPPPPLSPERLSSGMVLGTGEYALSPERPAHTGRNIAAPGGDNIRAPTGSHLAGEEDFPDRFREALERQQASFATQLATMEAALAKSEEAVRAQASQLRAVHAENDTLKETVASLARFMERKHLESPELRAQHILALHRTVADLRAQLRIQEELAALGGHRTEEAAGEVIDSSCSQEVYREREAQAQRVEAMLLNALLAKAPPSQVYLVKK